ncbi:MotA/TolQ/ExbB proton channel family protein [bacterium]|nr:MotA/TolQ/ExbB proton channel family protein [bacterium]
MDYSFFNIIKISPVVMSVLLFCSILMITYALERFFYFSRAGKFKETYWVRVKTLVEQNKLNEAIIASREEKGLVPQVIKVLLEQSSQLNRLDLEDTVTIYKQRIRDLLSRKLGLFGTMSFISPLLGLLGTVLGIIRAFHDLALSGSGGPTIVAAGISEALITTVAGIVVAIPSAVVYNILTYKIRGKMTKIDTCTQELLILLFRKKRTAKKAEMAAARSITHKDDRII